MARGLQLEGEPLALRGAAAAARAHLGGVSTSLREIGPSGVKLSTNDILQFVFPFVIIFREGELQIFLSQRCFT